MRSFILMWKRMFDFKGTTSIGEFWIGLIVNFIVSIVLFSVLAQSLEFETLSVVYLVYFVLFLFASLSMVVRRIRDADRSVANLLWVFVPVLGEIIIFFILISKSRAEREREFDRYHW